MTPTVKQRAIMYGHLCFFAVFVLLPLLGSFWVLTKIWELFTTPVLEVIVYES